MREERLAAALAAFRQFHAGLWQGAALAPWREVDLTMPQLKALLMICSAEMPSGRELGRALGVGPSTVSALVDRLVERGWVRREEDTDDRRITRLVPTAEGAELVARLQAAGREHLTRLLARLDDDELTLVTRALQLLCRASAACLADASDRADGGHAGPT